MMTSWPAFARPNAASSPNPELPPEIKILFFVILSSFSPQPPPREAGGGSFPSRDPKRVLDVHADHLVVGEHVGERTRGPHGQRIARGRTALEGTRDAVDDRCVRDLAGAQTGEGAVRLHGVEDLGAVHPEQLRERP